MRIFNTPELIGITPEMGKTILLNDNIYRIINNIFKLALLTESSRKYIELMIAGTWEYYSNTPCIHITEER
jgi:hypothetical protein